MPNDNSERVALVTGGARRIGAAIVRALHSAGCRVIAHHHTSHSEAVALAAELNASRPESCAVLAADLRDTQAVCALAAEAAACWGRIDLLVNNASGFSATPLGRVDDAQWETLFGSNVKGAFFLSQALAPRLAERRGAIVNIVDVHGVLPLRDYAVYGMAKAALSMMTRALALELGPAVRVNAVAPGPILWPSETGGKPLSGEQAGDLLGPTALGRIGEPADIASAVRYLGLEAGFVTGQMLAVDGGRTLY